MTSLNVANCTALTWLECYDNILKSLDLTKNILLRVLYSHSNALESLDLSKCTKLESLYCDGNKLTSLDASKNTLLGTIKCDHNALESLDLSKCTKLNKLFCGNNNLKSLDLSNCPIVTLSCNDNKLTTLKLSASYKKLQTLVCYDNSLWSLDLSNQIYLKELRCSSNKLSSLVLSDCELLEILYCHSNELASLNLSKNTKLTELSCGNNYLTYLDLSKNTFLTYSDAGFQTSIRRFQIMSSNSNTNNCWALYVGTRDASRIRNLTIDGVSKDVTLLNNDAGWMVVSDDLKKIPKKVTYQYDTSHGWMVVTVNYDVKNYGVYIDGTELTSLNFYDIPGLKSGTAYFTDEYEGIGWSGYRPTLVLNNAKIESKKGLVNEDCYYFKIIARGDNEIKATGYNAFDNSGAAVYTVFSGGGTIRFIATGSDTATGGNWNGMYAGDVTTTELKEGTTVICKGIGYGYFDDCGRLYIEENSALMAYGTKYPSIELPKESDRHFDSNIAIRYPVGAYYDDKYSVCYAGTTTKVQKDWVVIGPPGATPPQGIKGDVNGDGDVTIADGVAVLNAMAGETVPDNPDVNGDGDVTIADFVAVLNIMAQQ